MKTPSNTVSGNESEGYLIVDKRLLRLYGTQMAVFMGNLIDKYFYWKQHSAKFDGSFFLTHSQQTAQTGLSDHQIRQCKREAVLNQWLTLRSKGSPSREFYELNLEAPEIQSAIKFLKGKSFNFSRTSPLISQGHIIITDNNYSSSHDEKNNNNDSSMGRISPDMFDQFWEMYPRKARKGKAKITWSILCTQKDRPTWAEIKRAIHFQKKSEQWKEMTFIPHPATWLEGNRWLDDPKEMKAFKKHVYKEPIYDDGIKYVWDPELERYKHSVTGTIYIP